MDAIATSAASEPALIPYPKLLVRHDSAFAPDGPHTIAIVADPHAADRHACLVAARQLRDELLSATGRRWPIGAGGGRTAGITLDVDPAIGTDRIDACHVTIGANRIDVTGADMAGLRRGVQILRQLIRRYGDALPAMTINDHADMPIRALSYDVSRGRVPTLGTLMRLADTLCLYGFNQLQLYVEHVVDFDDTREAWLGNDPLTTEEIAELDDHCAGLGIELVPALATFGHLYDILRTRRFRRLGEHPEWADRPFGFVERMLHHTLDPIDPDARAFMKRRMDDYAALFRSDRFNIGGDETFDLGTGTSAAAARERGVPRLYADYVGDLCAHLESRGRLPMMYADIPIKHPELLGTLPRDVLLANWDYMPHPNEANIRKVTDSGYAQVVCPGVQTWNRLLPDLDAAWTNITGMCGYGHRYGARGVIATDWGDYGHVNDPMMSLPGLLLAAECAWNAGTPDRDTMERRIAALAFGDATGSFTGLLRGAARAQTFSWADLVQYKELDDHGAANRDVLFVLGQPVDESLDEARRRFLDDRRASIGRGAETGATLDACIGRLSSQRVGDPGHRATAALMMRGQRLFNRIGAWLLAATDDADGSGNGVGHREDGGALADAIGDWLVDYDARWRAIGKEADLRRIHDVLCWYADLLRGTATDTETETSTETKTSERRTAWTA